MRLAHWFVLVLFAGFGFGVIMGRQPPQVDRAAVAAVPIPQSVAELAAGVGSKDTACGWIKVSDLGLSAQGNWVKRDAKLLRVPDEQHRCQIIREGTWLHIMVPDTSKDPAILKQVDSKFWLPMEAHLSGR